MKTTPKSNPSKPESDRHESDDDAPVGALLDFVPEKFAQTWVTSLIIHTALIVLLAVVTLTQIEDDSIALSVVESPNPNSFIETPLDLMELEEPLEEELEMEELTETFEDVMLESDISVDNFDTEMSPLMESDFGNFSAAEEMGDALMIGENSGATTNTENKPMFFNAGDKAKKIVYVVDNSNSMKEGRMETALVELDKSIRNLDYSQEFYIVFYSDTAYGLFHPKTVKNYVKASPDNKAAVSSWLETVQCCLQTNGTNAFKVAKRLEPDLVYVLGDGNFTDKAHEFLLENPIKGAVVHTLGMQLKPQSAKRFESIAKAHNGTYRDVGITLEGRKILNQFGERPRNNRRGKIWGVTLPVNRKLKQLQ